MLKYFQRVAKDAAGGAVPSSTEGGGGWDLSEKVTPAKRKEGFGREREVPPPKAKAEKASSKRGKGGGSGDKVGKVENTAAVEIGKDGREMVKADASPNMVGSAGRRRSPKKGTVGAGGERGRAPPPPTSSNGNGVVATTEKVVATPSAVHKSPRKQILAPKEEEGSVETQEVAEGITAYEMMREKNIARNNELLSCLNIAKLPVPRRPTPAVDGGGKRKARDWSRFSEGRRSSSRLSANPEELVSLPETWDEGDESKRRVSKRPRAAEGDEEKEEEEEEIDAANLVPPPSMAVFQGELLRLQEAALPAFMGAGQIDWEAFARAKWGKYVGQCKGSEKVDDWKLFVTSRCPVLPDTAGSGMLQEDYCGDVYRLLISCVLMSRVSSHDCKTRCINAFFDACPTPSDVRDTSDVDITAIIKPLGLSESRIKSVRELTAFFLEQKRFQIGLEKPIKPCGVGPFTYESYLIFCCGQGRLINTNDKALSGYTSWLRRKPVPDMTASFAVAALVI